MKPASCTSLPLLAVAGVLLGLAGPAAAGITFHSLDSGEAGPTVAVVGLDGPQSVAVRAGLGGLASRSPGRGRLVVALDTAERLIAAAFQPEADWAGRAASIGALLEDVQPDWLVLLSEDYDFHATIPAALGSTVACLEHDAEAQQMGRALRDALNATADGPGGPWVSLAISANSSHPRLRVSDWWAAVPHALMVTTSAKNVRKEQTVALRVAQMTIAVDTLLDRLDMGGAGAGEARVRLAARPDGFAVAVYNGPGAVSSSGHDPLWILQSIAHLPLQAALVTPEEIRLGGLARFDTLVIGGGSAKDQARGLGVAGRAAVRRFVEQGGGYVGVCAGAFLALGDREDRLGLVQARSVASSGTGLVPLAVAPAGRATLTLDGVHQAKLAGGPLFDPGGLPDGCEAWATYADDLDRAGDKPLPTRDKAAIVAAAVGRGRVVLFGPHCERWPGPQEAFWRSLAWSAGRTIGSPARITRTASRPAVPGTGESTRIDRIRRALMRPQDEGVLIVAHRGHHACEPENSVAAIHAAADVGAHAVEIDLRKTADSRYVLMHDRTVDRTTTGRGEVARMTLAQLGEVRLRHGIRPTAHRVPTFLEALEAARGRVMLNIDLKTGELSEVIDVARQANLLDHCVFKAPWGKLTEGQVAMLKGQAGLLFMPMVETPDEADRALDAGPFVVLELHFPHESWQPTDTVLLQSLRRRGARLWVNALGDGPGSAALGDRHAVDEPRVFVQLSELGFGVIQTDLPEVAAEVLREHRVRMP